MKWIKEKEGLAPFAMNGAILEGGPYSFAPGKATPVTDADFNYLMDGNAALFEECEGDGCDTLDGKADDASGSGRPPMEKNGQSKAVAKGVAKGRQGGCRRKRVAEMTEDANEMF